MTPLATLLIGTAFVCLVLALMGAIFDPKEPAMSTRIAPDDATLVDYLEPLAEDLADPRHANRAGQIKDEIHELLNGEPGDYPAGRHTVHLDEASRIAVTS